VQPTSHLEFSSAASADVLYLFYLKFRTVAD